MKLTMLGTGHALVTECYNTCFVISEGRNHFLVDGGGGNTILKQLKDAGISLDDIHEVFITHKHTDHLLGIVWVVRVVCQQMMKGKYDGILNVYGHNEVLNLLRDMARNLLWEKEFAFIDDRILLHEVTDGQRVEIIGHKTTFFDVCSKKAKQFGFSMEIRENERLTCCGDEPLNDTVMNYAENAKWLLHEAFCLYSERDIHKPYEKHHSTVKDACELAENLGVQNLVLYHTEDDTIADRKNLYTREGKAYYHGNLFVPDDLEIMNL